MPSDAVRTRFAPSPTGSLHLGNARTALFAWLYARGRGGRFMLRIEDTDQARSTPEATAALLEDLRWLGLAWDEGPGVGGPHGPYLQSERKALYDACFERLLRDGRAYPCFCSPEALAFARRAQLAAGRPPRYAGPCAALAEAEAASRVARGEPATLRFRVPAGERVGFEDLVRGAQHFASEDIGDFVIRRADGSGAFFFCNAVDDALMEVTDVLRGEDHLTNTPRQLLLLEALGLAAPRYGHLSLVVGADGRPLSKREGAPSLSEYRARGVCALPLVNALARLGQAYAEPGLLAPEALAAGFAPEHLGRAAARFDEAQLLHWQREHLATLPTEALAAWMGEEVSGLVPEAQGAAFVEAVRANVTLPAEALAWARTLFGPLPAPEAAVRAVLEEAGEAYFAAASELAREGLGEFRDFARALGERTGRRGKALYGPMRAALTGRLDGPELAALFALLGEERILQRLEDCL